MSSGIKDSVREGMKTPAEGDLQIKKSTQGGTRTRAVKKPVPDYLKDAKYFAWRRRNNISAKKSRDARKLREEKDPIDVCLERKRLQKEREKLWRENRKWRALHVAPIEEENAMLRAQIAKLRSEENFLNVYLNQKCANEAKISPFQFLANKQMMSSLSELATRHLLLNGALMSCFSYENKRRYEMGSTKRNS